jgi:mono/diheme cytochrome c family protein
MTILPGVAIGAGLVIVVIVLAMGPKADAGPGVDPRKRGKRIYTTICGMCHHPDPTQQYGTSGAFGPPIAGSSFELLKMRVRNGRYPKGYKPKRTTRLMTSFELTDDQLRALHAFVSDPNANKSK